MFADVCRFRRKRKRDEDDDPALAASGSVAGARPAAGSPPPPSSAPPAPQPEPERALAAAARMYERGIRMADIAHVLEVDERNVAMALVKRARKGGHPNEAPDVQAEQDSPGRERSEGVLQLAIQLQHDPPELTCPIMHTLMDDPVVAEDGYTYERQGIESALQIRSRSPMTNEPMGKAVVPNRGLKSRIQEYKETVLTEILSVTPCLMEKCAGGTFLQEAAALLMRAEELVRPKLPDRAARRHLVAALQLRSRLPPPHCRGAGPCLAQLLVEDDNTTQLIEILDRFHILFDAASLSDLQAETLWKLFELASDQAGRGVDQPSDALNVVGKELVKRCASAMQEPEEAQAAAALRKLWGLLVALCKVDPEAWLEGVAALLADCSDRLEPDLSVLGTPILERAMEFAEDRPALDAAEEKLLGASLPEALVSGGTSVFVRVLIELSLRQDDAAAIHTLQRASLLAPESGDLRRTRLALVQRHLRAGQEVDEPALLALLHSENAELPPALLEKLVLDPEDLSRASAPALLALAAQLSRAGRKPHAARVTVAAALQQELAGEHAAEQTFRDAFLLDRSNEAAAEGIFRASVAAGARSAQMEERVRCLEEDKSMLEAQCVAHQAQISVQEDTIQHLQQRGIWRRPSLPGCSMRQGEGRRNSFSGVLSDLRRSTNAS